MDTQGWSHLPMAWCRPSSGPWLLQEANPCYLPDAVLAQSACSGIMPGCPAHSRISSRPRDGPAPTHLHLIPFSASSNPKLLLSGTSLSLTPLPALPAPSCPSLPPGRSLECLSLQVFPLQVRTPASAKQEEAPQDGGSGASISLAAQQHEAQIPATT